MSDPHVRFHAEWLGMVQPSEGLTLSIPVLVDAQIMERQPADLRTAFRDHCPEGKITDLPAFFEEILDLELGRHFDVGDDLPDDLALYVTEGRQTLTPTWGLRGQSPRALPEGASAAEIAGAPYAALLWDLPPGLPLDTRETTTGDWDYPPGAKFDRLLRACGVPVGLLTNRRVIRLIYAPKGQSSGWIDFRIADMIDPAGAPILDAFIVLLRAERWLSVASEETLPGLMAQSRDRQANVTNALAEQVFEALQALLQGFDRANDRDPARPLDAAFHDDDLYGGLLTVMLRLVFLLYAEEHGLLPVEHPLYAQHLSVIDLYERLVEDEGLHPDEMDQRFGAWPRLLATFRAVYFGVAWQPNPDSKQPALHLPARSGGLFDPDRHPWLEGRPLIGAASLDPTQNGQIRTPAIDDGTLLAVLKGLIVIEGQRLSYKALDVEQIGSVYERLMGYSVVRVPGTAARLKPSGVWLSGEEILAQPASGRPGWLQAELGLSRGKSKTLASALRDLEDTAEGAAAALEILVEHAGQKRNQPLAQAGEMVLQPGAERRRTSSHYTPRTLSAPIVARTLEPLLRCLGEAPTADQILSLKICDPAMGSGAFLVEACRYLAEQVVAAWTLHQATPPDVGALEPALHARRLVAQRCLYGVDKNPFAVDLARISMWLITLARDLPFTFVDHALRHGDSLVGLSLDQIRAFHWDPPVDTRKGKKKAKKAAESGQVVMGFLKNAIDRALDDTVEIREQILALADSTDTAHKLDLLDQAEYLTDRVRDLADACVGAFFAHEKPADREKERQRRHSLVERWLSDENSDEGVAAGLEIQALAADLRATLPTFHWMLEFPEVFYLERPDPLAPEETGVAWMDAFIGNPPFLGGRRIRSELGDGYTEWLGSYFKCSKNADISAHFFTRANHLLGPHGTLGLIATNTIAQGDTREAGLARLVAADNALIYDATTHMSWPGDAAVTVSVVHMAKGEAIAAVEIKRLDGQSVSHINSQLQPKSERPNALSLNANTGLSFQGAVLVGTGFTLTPEERVALITQNPLNAELIYPYLGGQEVNSSPTQSHSRYVINFGEMPLDEAEKWPDLINIIRERVKPARDQVRREAHKKYWWHFGDKRPALFSAIKPLDRCLVNSQVSKHLLFAWQPTDRVFGHALYVYPLTSDTAFAILQSRVHEYWARLLSSSLEDRLRYAPSDCFSTFPFPEDMTQPALNAAGEALYSARAAYMVAQDQGLTPTYNQLKDPGCTTPEIQQLRRLHEAMDRAVLAAYGWADIEVPPYGIASEAQTQAFEDEVIDRLFVLNGERAKTEASALRAAKAAQKAKTTKAKGKTAAKKPAAKKSAKPPETPAAEEQEKLL